MINPTPNELLFALNLSFASFNNGFTKAHAEAITGQNVRVAVRDSGLTARYEGIVQPVNETITKIGEEEILNECVFAIRLLAYS